MAIVAKENVLSHKFDSTQDAVHFLWFVPSMVQDGLTARHFKTDSREGEAPAEPCLPVVSARQEPRPPGFETAFSKTDAPDTRDSEAAKTFGESPKTETLGEFRYHPDRLLLLRESLVARPSLHRTGSVRCAHSASGNPGATPV